MASLDLSVLGWDDSWAAAFAPHAADHLTPGRVVRVDKGRCDLLTPEGEVQAARGAAVRRAAATDGLALPCAGDWVALRLLPDSRYEVTAVLERRTAFVRGGVARGSRSGLSGDSHGQVLAANVDVAYIAEPAAGGSKGSDLARVERLLALAWESGAQPVVVITKADLAADLPQLLANVNAAAPGVDVHAVSVLAGEGVDALRIPEGRTAVLLGPSGAGKSTLVNALAQATVMETQQVRASDGRGRHTTTHRELILLPGGGLVVDTPGLRRVGLYDADEGLSQVFTDVEELAADCRFSDCVHDQEPGCAVRAAVASGELPERRLASWHKLRREAEWMASRTDARLRAERTRQWKIIHKQMRRDPGRS